MTARTSPESARDIPEATVARLPVYLRALVTLSESGTVTCSSEELAVAAGVNSAKLRKDLSYLGSYGTRGVGYDVDYLSCQVYGAEGWGPPLDHCALMVHLDGERWFVDVGFGDCCMVPVRMTDGEHDAVPRRLRFTIGDDSFSGEVERLSLVP